MMIRDKLFCLNLEREYLIKLGEDTTVVDDRIHEEQQLRKQSQKSQNSWSSIGRASYGDSAYGDSAPTSNFTTGRPDLWRPGD